MSDLFKLEALPPAEAIAYLEAKGLDLAPSFAWQDMFHEDHTAAFTVAKSAGFDILKDVHGAVVDSLKNGTTFESFRQQLTPILQDKGWWGRKELVDPATGDLVDAQLGSVRRLRTIYDTNMRMAHAAATWQQAVRTQATRPYLRYTAILDSKTRPAHRAWHGTILPIGHPWWETHMPPCGWFCRCRVLTLSEADLRRYGFKVDDAPREDPFPPQIYTNPRTGQVSVVPFGIDPGFAYNPGESSTTLHAARAAAYKWTDAPAPITAAQQAASIRVMLPLLARDFGGWVDQVAGAQRLIGDQRVIGALTNQVLEQLAGRGIQPQSGAVTITDRTIAHMLRDAKVIRGAALPAEALRSLPDIIADPVAVLFDQQDPAFLYVFDAPGGVGKIVVRVDFADKVARQTVVTNAVRTGGLVQPGDLAAPRYVTIEEGAQPPGGTPPSP